MRTEPPQPFPFDWSDIGTVCLDMDGTVLDLHFDNLFWLEALPRRYAELNGLDEQQAHAALKPRFDAKRGTLDWYCTDHWSEELGLDVAALKLEMRHHIRFLPGAPEFLHRLHEMGKRVLLTTNAHPISLAIKAQQAGLRRHFDELVSSHEFEVPKESPEFWSRLAAGHAVDPRHTLFVDDSLSVLHAARAAGVRWIFQVLQPDSTRPAHAAQDGFMGIRGLTELIP
jgi:putative hydrolase of the HAD superfamily